MKTTTNYGFKKPESNDPYNINDINESLDIIDATLKAASDKADIVTTHPSDMNNPHQTTAAQVGLGNVPNVATNDQTPTYTVAAANEALSSGEKLSVAFGKIAKAIASLISHLANTSNPHGVTKAQIGLGNVDNTADSAKSVNYATSAGSATSATTATNATNAVNADTLDGLHAASFIQTSQSVKVIVSTTAPTDTTAVWIVPS